MRAAVLHGRGGLPALEHVGRGLVDLDAERAADGERVAGVGAPERHREIAAGAGRDGAEQVDLGEELEEIASRSHKKLGTLVREAIEEYHLKKNKQQKIAEAVDRLLSLPEVPAPEDYQKWEAEYLEGKYSCR